MEINPIYEGVVYDTIPGESFKPLLVSTSRRTSDSSTTMDLAGSSPRYVETHPNCSFKSTDCVEENNQTACLALGTIQKEVNDTTLGTSGQLLLSTKSLKEDLL